MAWQNGWHFRDIELCLSLSLSLSALPPSLVWGPETYQATQRIYDRGLELHTLDFSSNRSISTGVQAMHKSNWWGDKIRKKKKAEISCISTFFPPKKFWAGIQLEASNDMWCVHLRVHLQQVRLDGVMHSKANPNTTGLCAEPAITAVRLLR